MALNRPTYPVDSSGNPIPATLANGRYDTQAPSFRGQATEVFFLETGAIVYLAEEAVGDEFRWYQLCVKNDTSNAIDVVDMVIDGTTIVFDGATLVNGTKDNASTVNIYWDGTASRYEIQNNLAASAEAYVALVRKA